jgi:hypothetical protein
MNDESEYGAIDGQPDAIIYHCHLIGGPKDGEIANCFRPYHYLLIEDNEYQADTNTDYVQWETDGSRQIDLFFKGKT